MADDSVLLLTTLSPMEALPYLTLLLPRLRVGTLSSGNIDAHASEILEYSNI